MAWLKCFVLLLGFVGHAGAAFNPSTDFSLEKNPNGVWQYGYSAERSLDPSQFRFDEYVKAAGPIGFWHPKTGDQHGSGYYPYIAYNTTARSQLGSSNAWAVRGGEIAMEASNTGQYSLVRFVAPFSGHFGISAHFEGVHFGLSSTDVHVLLNRRSLFDGIIDGYGGDPAFHRVEGASPTAKYSGQVDLRAGDIIAFAVGYGQNKTNFCDTTGLVAQIVLLSGAGSQK